MKPSLIFLVVFAVAGSACGVPLPPQLPSLNSAVDAAYWAHVHGGKKPSGQVQNPQQAPLGQPVKHVTPPLVIHAPHSPGGHQPVKPKLVPTLQPPPGSRQAVEPLPLSAQHPQPEGHQLVEHKHVVEREPASLPLTHQHPPGSHQPVEHKLISQLRVKRKGVPPEGHQYPMLALGVSEWLKKLPEDGYGDPNQPLAPEGH